MESWIIKEIYMEQPLGFIIHIQEHKVCYLHQFIDDLK